MSTKPELLRKGIERVSNTLLIGFNFNKDVVYVANWFRFNPPSNPNHAHKVLSELKALPDCDEKYNAIIDFADCCREKGWDLKQDPLAMVPKGYQKGIERVSPPDQTRLDQTERRLRPDKGASNAPFVLPDWLPEQDWNDFLDMRRQKRATSTARAHELVIRKLDQLRMEGEDPALVLQQSIINSWTDVYPLKGNKHASSKDNAKPRGNAAHAEIGKDARRAVEQERLQRAMGPFPEGANPRPVRLLSPVAERN